MERATRSKGKLILSFMVAGTLSSIATFASFAAASWRETPAVACTKRNTDVSYPVAFGPEWNNGGGGSASIHCGIEQTDTLNPSSFSGVYIDQFKSSSDPALTAYACSHDMGPETVRCGNGATTTSNGRSWISLSDRSAWSSTYMWSWKYIVVAMTAGSGFYGYELDW
jgi:hypothetical protein